MVIVSALQTCIMYVSWYGSADICATCVCVGMHLDEDVFFFVLFLVIFSPFFVEFCKILLYCRKTISEMKKVLVYFTDCFFKGGWGWGGLM